MAKDIVLVPTYWRPEYLDQTLASIFACDGIENKHVWVCQDRRPTDVGKFSAAMLGTGTVIHKYDKQIRYIDREPHRFEGCSFNVVDSCRKASETGCERVFLIEEDVVVSKDFFTWHESVQNQVDCFCSIAWRPDRYSAVVPSKDPGFFVIPKAYSGIGTCFKRESIATVANMGYANVRVHGEHDCQIRDHIDRTGQVIAGAYKPRAFHIGVVGNQRLCVDGSDCDAPTD